MAPSLLLTGKIEHASVFFLLFMTGDEGEDVDFLLLLLLLRFHIRNLVFLAARKADGE